MLRKLMLLAAMLAMVLAAAAPAFAQDQYGQDQYQDQDADSGDVTNEGSGGVDVSGDDNTFEDVNIAQCTAVLNQVNTGNQQTQQAIEQYGYFYAYQYADQDSAQYIVQNAELVQYCAQAVGDVTATAVGADDDDDAAAAAAGGSASTPGASASGGSASAGGSSSSSSSLPATGGLSLLTLGAGALLVAGGLVARRIVR